MRLCKAKLYLMNLIDRTIAVFCSRLKINQFSSPPTHRLGERGQQATSSKGLHLHRQQNDEERCLLPKDIEKSFKL